MNYNEVPIWAIFEILTMGDFGYLLSCLTMNMREKISRAIGINLSCDTHRELVYKYVYTLKDLRNAIAHNDVEYDTRFRKIDPSRPMKQCLIFEMELPYINFKTIGVCVCGHILGGVGEIWLLFYFQKYLRLDSLHTIFAVSTDYSVLSHIAKHSLHLLG